MRNRTPPTIRLLALWTLLGLSTVGAAQDVPVSGEPTTLQPTTPPATTLPPALPVAPAAPRVVSISQASFILETLHFEGHPELLSDAQRAGLAQAVADGFPAALARKYPQAHVVTPDDLSAVRLTPVVVVPPSLSPFEEAVFRLDLRLPQGETRSVEGRFNLLNLWLAQAGALQIAWDGTLAGLPPQ